jgi:hypothetical protein
VDNLFWCQVNYLVLNQLFGVPSINFGDEIIYFGATTILFGGPLNGCHRKIVEGKQLRFCPFRRLRFHKYCPLINVLKLWDFGQQQCVMASWSQ